MTHHLCLVSFCIYSARCLSHIHLRLIPLFSRSSPTIDTEKFAQENSVVWTQALGSWPRLAPLPRISCSFRCDEPEKRLFGRPLATFKLFFSFLFSAQSIRWKYSHIRDDPWQDGRKTPDVQHRFGGKYLIPLISEEQ